MIKFVLNRLQLLIKDRWTWVLLYLVSLLFGLAVGIPFFFNAKKIGGNSMELDRLVAEFDFSTFFDFLRIAKKQFQAQYIVTAILGLVYLFLNIFFAGGVIDRAENLNDKFKLGRFFSQSWKTFPKYLLVYILMVLLAICVFFACGIFYFVATLMADSGNDRSLILWLSIPTFLLILSISFVLAVQDYAKVLIYKYEHLGIGTSFSKAFSFVFKRPKALLNLWILVGLALFVFGIYLGLDSVIGMTGMFTIVLFFVVQQLVSFVRIFLRFSHLGIALEYLNLNPITIPEPKALIELEDDLDKILSEDSEPLNEEDEKRDE